MIKMNKTMKKSKKNADKKWGLFCHYCEKVSMSNTKDTSHIFGGRNEKKNRCWKCFW